MQLFLSLVIFATLVKGNSWAEPNSCYDCRNTSVCDDPVKTNLLDTCHFMEAMRNTSVTNIFDANLFSKFNITVNPNQVLKNPLIPVGINTGKSCIKFILSSGDQRMTTRTCGAKYGNGIEICKYVEETIDLHGLNFTCRSCDTDYCNSSSQIGLSLFSVVILIFFLNLFK